MFYLVLKDSLPFGLYTTIVDALKIKKYEKNISVFQLFANSDVVHKYEDPEYEEIKENEDMVKLLQLN
jgi:hypothetical protein